MDEHTLLLLLSGEEGDKETSFFVLNSWKVREGEAILEGDILCEYYNYTNGYNITNSTNKSFYLRAPQTGYIKQINKLDNSIVQSSDVVGVIFLCTHDVKWGGLCAVCGKDITHLGIQHITHAHPKLAGT